ncbi:hypothetical protein PHAMO_270009 [Magnetospirillum molischianum DSM 120]|uniref:Uncharacterized protein n=1 Tax=Magnetospirillum molischianum DSM 120 TaxID=1150626 RepID=H8FS30_MAGML|nr:hypothetical protein PHAMO_270009 [Magnetospirillum molischianum DSM 120]
MPEEPYDALTAPPGTPEEEGARGDVMFRDVF